MRIAVALTGHIRTLDLTIKSFVDAFPSARLDFFLITYSNKYGYHDCNKRRLSFYEDIEFSEAEIRSIFQDLNLIELKLLDSKDYLSSIKKPTWKTYENLSDNVLYPLLLFSEVMKMIDQYKSNQSICYDYIIKSRCDLVLKPRLKLPKLNSDQILINKYNVFPNDWIFIGEFNLLNRLVLRTIQEVYKPSKRSATLNPPHGFYQVAAAELNINFIEKRLVKGILRATGNLEWNRAFRFKVRFKSFYYKYLNILKWIINRF
jgi:hypothetical protein